MTRELRDLAVVLVNYRSIADVAERLASGVLNDARQVVLVDNGDAPERVKALCSEYGCTPVLLDENRGFAAGVNAGLRVVQQQARYVLLLNPDVVLTREALVALVRDLEEQRADAVAPLLAEADGRLQVGSAGGPLTAWSYAAYFLFLSHLSPVRGIFLTRRQSRRPQQVDWLCMACLVTRRDAFERFGAVPEDELVYGEDIAWGTRATSLGARLRLSSDVRVTHRHGSSGGSGAWSGAMRRLALRRLGPGGGRLACWALQVGLAARRVAGRGVGAAG